MTVSSRVIALVFGILALFLPGAALAQENLDAGKTPAQLFHSDCVMCHKTTRGLSRGGGAIGGLAGFLREHYTASRESAAAIAGYIRQTDRGSLPSHRRHTAWPRHKSADKNVTDKHSDEKKAEKKSSLPDGAKTTDKKATNKKTDEAAAGNKKSGEAKATDKNKEKKKVEAMPAPK